MLLVLLLDVLLVVVIVAGLARGARAGLLYTLGATVGAVIGAVGAFLLVPPIAAWVPDPTWRPLAVFAAIAILVGGGLTVGEAIGRTWRRGVTKRLRPIDRLGGLFAGGAVTVLVISLLGSTITALGIPVVSSTAASSGILRVLDSLTPDPVARALGQVRGLVVEQGIPRIADALGELGPTSPPVIDAGSPELTAAAQSVGRVTGAAYACGQVQSGTAFVIAPDRLLTNAHVVAGVDEPTIELPGIGGRTGRIVYFDAQQDIALIAVDGLEVEPLGAAETLPQGSIGAVQGYPFGGPFVSGGAEVVAVGTIAVDAIDGSGQGPRDTYTLAADVNPGNSGGPVLSLDGDVVGMVFAKAQLRDDIGYAHTMAELDPVIDAAPSLSEPVASGSCSR